MRVVTERAQLDAPSTPKRHHQMGNVHDTEECVIPDEEQWSVVGNDDPAINGGAEPCPRRNQEGFECGHRCIGWGRRKPDC